MSTTVHKALHPDAVGRYLQRGYDRVAGLVVPGADAVGVTTPRGLFALHGLGFDGSPFSPDDPYLHVLELVTTQQTELGDAAPFGGTPAQRRLVTARVTAGSRIVRYDVEGGRTVVATFADIATGWVSDVVEISVPSARLSRYVGTIAGYQGAHLAADLVDGGSRVALGVATAPPHELAFTLTSAGRWRKEVPRTEVDDVFEVLVTGTVQGLPVRALDSWRDHDGTELVWCAYSGAEPERASALGWGTADPAVFEFIAPQPALTDVVSARIVVAG